MRAFEIPDERNAQITWLESEVLGTQLHSLIAELAAVHGERDDAIGTSNSVPSWSSDVRDRVREQGFAALSDEQFESMLKSPRQLLQIQQDVLENGGRYWSEVAPPSDLPVARFESPTAMKPDARALDGDRGRGLKSNVVWALVASLATAAALLLLLRPPVAANLAKTPSPTNPSPSNNSPMNPSQLNPAPSSQSPSAQAPAEHVEVPTELPVVARPVWGFAKFTQGVEAGEDNLDPPLNREAYLRELAHAAEAWTNKKPDTTQALAERIGEFRMGCSAILLATHEPLPNADRTWLRDRCRSWASALDRHLAAVEAGQPIDEVRAAVDSTVTKIAAALLGRAETQPG